MTVAATLTVESLESSIMALYAVIGDHNVPEDREDSVWHRHLHDEVGVMRYGHELGEHRLPKDGVIRGAELRDLERQVLRAKVLLCAKGDH
jgi:hypothetical protein